MDISSNVDMTRRATKPIPASPAISPSPSPTILSVRETRPRRLRLVRTSGWHLGQTLIGEPREEEHRALLARLLLAGRPAAEVEAEPTVREKAAAQGLTLDALVAHANGHLADLSKRCRLERVPGSDLERMWSGARREIVYC